MEWTETRRAKKPLFSNDFEAERNSQKKVFGGEGGIRTHVTVAGKPHFECGAFDHSATSPRGLSRIGAPHGQAAGDRKRAR